MKYLLNWRLWLILILVGGISSVFLKAKTVEAVKVSRQDISHDIVATGKIASTNLYEISSLIPAQITDIPVKEGDWVQAGQPLVILSDATQSANLRQAQTALEEANLKYKELTRLTRPLAQASLQQATANLQLAEQDLKRQQQLKQKNMTSTAQLEQAERNLTLQQAALKTAELQWQAVQVNGITEQLLQNKQQQAERNLAITQAKANQLVLTAPHAGQILQRNLDIGNTVSVGKPILTLADPQRNRIEVGIDEKNLAYLQIGQNAEVIADAFLNDPFQAKVSLIYPRIDANRATVPVRLRIESVPDFILPDMTVSIRITTNQAKQVLVLPSDVIQDADTNHPWVWTITQGKSQMSAVTLGIQGIGYSQITTGLNEGDWVISQSEIKDGQRVSPTPRSQQRPKGFDLPKGLN